MAVPTPTDATPISDIARQHLRWALTPDVGPIAFGHLCERFGSAEAAWGASAAQLEQVPRIGSRKADKIAGARESIDIEREISAATKLGARIICQADEDYPHGLREIADPPIVLYVKGELRPTDTIALAIVGTRRCSIYGSEQARRFAELAAGCGLTVISGLARGVDAFAHHGALDAKGRTLAIMGAPLSEIYPPENATLAERILTCGAWISEVPLSSHVERRNFPSRNRIIAGMTLGTLVVEAPLRSGALITARLASEYNREVFVIPGRLQEPTAAGTNALIRDSGAKLVTDLNDILCELGEVGYQFMARENLNRANSVEPAPAAPKLPLALTPVESRVLETIPTSPILQGMVQEATNLPIGDVLAALTALELKGAIKRLPGQMVVRSGAA
jgi:DNA processing protein